MAEQRYTKRIVESTPSSAGLSSHRGTPETKLTEFSPDDGLAEDKAAGANASGVNLPPSFLLREMASTPKAAEMDTQNRVDVLDPFTSLPVKSKPASFRTTSQLSPNAASFEPPHKAISSVQQLAVTEFQPLAPIEPSAKIVGTPLGDHLIGSSTELVEMSKPAGFLRKGFSDGSKSAAGKLMALAPHHQTSENTNGAGNEPLGHAVSNRARNIMLSNVPNVMSMDDLRGIFAILNLRSPDWISTVAAESGRLYLKFGDLRDAQKTYSQLQGSQGMIVCTYLSPRELALCFDHGDLSQISNYEGHVVVTAFMGGPVQSFNVPMVADAVKGLLRSCGDYAGCYVDLSLVTRLSFRVEFFNLAAADQAVAGLNGLRVGPAVLYAQYYVPDLIQKGQLPFGEAKNLNIAGNESNEMLEAFAGFGVSMAGNLLRAAKTPVKVMNSLSIRQQSFAASYAGPSGVPSNLNVGSASGFFGPYGHDAVPNHPARLPAPRFNQMGPGGFQQAPFGHQHHTGATNQRDVRRQNHRRSHHEYASPHHNVVDIEAIRKGLDVRTTIMLRNIPNRYDQAHLKALVDETSRGKYDFMYLRIDFTNNCNVGYAFINFEDPWSIIDFVQARAGRRWDPRDHFCSDKVAEVSYATIQGKDCLVQKFRNSSVMLEHASFRPKIFHTQGPFAGEEETFPLSDNASKMRRSIENAEHVGLYAPRAGQNYRDEQRRRRSQYDRGTRLAAIEDAYEGGDRGSRGPAGLLYHPLASSALELAKH